MKYFNHKEIKESYESLLNLLKTSTFSKNYPLYKAEKHGISYMITKVSNIPEEKDAFIVFPKPVEVIIKFKNSKKEQEKIIIHSSLDLCNYCKDNNINIYNLSIENVYNFNNNYLVCLSSYLKTYKLSLFVNEEKHLPFQNKKEPLEPKIIIKISELSKYYEDYFCKNIDPNTELQFEDNEISYSISFNLNLLLFGNDDSLTKFKFTGPVSIGKTAFLLNFCHISSISFYINLKLLKKINDLEKAYLIIKEEFSRSDYFEDIQKIIDTFYKQEVPPIELVFKIVDYFSKNNIKVLLAFDQFKDKYLNIKEKTKLTNLKANIKVVYCSSINDKSIHDECCSKTWNRFGGNPDKLDSETQEYYFYYSSLYEENNKKEKKENILDKFNGIYRYTKYFKDNIPKEESIKKVRGKKIFKDIE